MRTRMLLFVAPIVLLALTLLAGYSYGQSYTPSPNEVFYGTWVNEKMYPQKMVKRSDGSYDDYATVSDTTPFRGGRYEIFKKWTDSEGNVFYETYDTFSFGIHLKTQNLWRVSKSGTLLEMTYYVVWAGDEYSPDKFPKVEMLEYPSFIFNRSEK
jgi:hypothetical protein